MQVLRRGALLMILASASFAVMAACVRACHDRVPFFEVMFFRSAVALVPVALAVRARRVPLRTGRPLLMLSRGVAGFCSMACYFYGLTHLELADAVTLGCTAPVWLALIAPLALGEPLRAPVVAALAVAVVGVVILLRPSLAVYNVAGLVTLGSGFAGAIAYAAIRRLSTTDDPDLIVLGFTAIAALLSAVAMVPAFVAPRGTDWLYLVGSGLSAAAGQSLMTRAYALEEAAVVGALSYATVLFSWAIGVAVFREPIEPHELLGGVLLIAAGSSLGFARRGASPPARF